VIRRIVGSVDRNLVGVVAAIILLGLYNLSSASRPLGVPLHHTHAIHVAIGLGAAAFVAWLHYRNLETLAFVILFAVVGLLVATMFFGRVVNGSRRWLSLGLMSIQTSDLAKLAVVVVVARVFHLERWEGTLTLRDILRPLNVSRPLLVLGVVIALSAFGERLIPPELERAVDGRYRRVAELEQTVVVGRAADSGVRLAYTGVDARHAEIARSDADGRGFVVRDLDSSTGTFVNGERIEGEAEIGHRDVIRFGSSQRAELRLHATIASIRPWLPGVAVLGLLWLVAGFIRIRGGVTGPQILAPIDLVALPCVLILIQPDLGTTLVVLLIAFSMILFVGLRPRSLLALIGGSALGSILAWFALLKPYQKQRVLTFLNPTSDLAGAGYHQHQSLIAVGSGEWFGKGHAQGTQTQLSFLPEQQTDFIFSVWAEEHGFIGSGVVVALFAALILICLRAALRARDRFGALLIVGVTAMLFWHTVINMLMVLRLAPVVGVPLPFWSNGGSFVLTAMLGLGIVSAWTAAGTCSDGGTQV
jgi:cell division protein FtsW (lipid II flippase)